MNLPTRLKIRDSPSTVFSKTKRFHGGLLAVHTDKNIKRSFAIFLDKDFTIREIEVEEER